MVEQEGGARLRGRHRAPWPVHPAGLEHPAPAQEAALNPARGEGEPSPFAEPVSPAVVRQWAASKGFHVTDRGRIPDSVSRAFNAENARQHRAGASAPVDGDLDGANSLLAVVERQAADLEELSVENGVLLKARRDGNALSAERDRWRRRAEAAERDCVELEILAERVPALEAEIERLRVLVGGSAALLEAGAPELPECGPGWADHEGDQHALHSWQREALNAWAEAGHCGVVEAVTGAGKSLVAHRAARAALDEQRKVLVLTPTVELQRQWCTQLRQAMPAAAIGLCGDRNDDGFDRHDIVVATIQSAARREFLAAGQTGLLVADEVHGCGAPTYSRALSDRFGWRLGLTATYQREDNGNAEYLDPYFGGVCYRLWYDRALADGVIAPFRVAMVGVDLAAQEREEYDRWDEMAGTCLTRLVANGVETEPFGQFFRTVSELARGNSGAAGSARGYLKAFAERRKLLAETPVKQALLAELAPVFADTARVLIFTQTKASASSAAECLSALGCDADAIFSGMDDDERVLRMERFRTDDGSARVLTAPRILDQGIDIPETDLGVIVATSRTRRQMVQRLGRVVRRKADGRPGRFVVLFVRGTSEDPYAGEESSFLREVLPFAQDQRVFPGSDVAAVREFLAA